jgi:hypothetical protein
MTTPTPSASVDGYYLGAICTNATSASRAEVEWVVVFRDLDDRWVDRDGNPLWPFHVQPITQALPLIPEGWIDHLHDLAGEFTPPPAKTQLLEVLGLQPKPLAPIQRRL